ncbi:cellulose synthase subunit [Devosia lucknowensis]|uniref:Cyclic di-GMP-binding protein n=1 Tax=Devosia lucknowensis TaxID=1096929 RepID=A0A1Y6EG40_9HYPH|nr:cellulose biosynthesis cyclic di-GMP-binding regulatory protein BcsB [Devosia lucknowensis]SMQ60141.1 cellulose synthase subunit [Devosia lucknowensis]
MIRVLTPLALALMVGSAHAQQVPSFDMSPEAEMIVPVTPDPSASATAAPVIAAPDLIRYLLPAGTTRLAGEVDRRNYQIYLTPTQAAAKATLNLGYVNALVVAPESSRLRVQINGTTVMLNPVASSAGIAKVAVDVPSGVLRQGFNTVTITADQRHRTDCSIGSTYELWTDLSAVDSFLSFSGARVGQLSRLDDLAAAGWTSTGKSIVRVIMPSGTAMENGALLADLVQTLALTMRVANTEVQFANTLPASQEEGVLNVVLGPASQLPEGVGPLAQEARNAPVAAFGANNALVLSGPDWAGVKAAIDDLRPIAAQYEQYAGAIPPRADRALPVPILDGAGTLSFEQLGFEGLSFNGRRYRTQFSFALPADFYADRYGQAQITLSAAYSSEVRPGSQFDVFINGEIASVTPILRTDDALRDLPIKVPMSEFRPGVNTVEVVAALRTEADDICAPGTVTVGTDQRLLISSDSTFTMPDFGRISQVPNLAAFANTGFPYSGGTDTPDLVLGSGDAVLPAAMTFVARLAGQTNQAMAIKSVSLASPAPAQDAIFVGAYNQLPPDAIQRVGVLQPYASDDIALEVDQGSLDTILQRWRSTGTSNDASMLGRLQNWVAGLLDLGPNSLGVLPPTDEPYAPRLSDKAVVLQRLQPEGGLWTMLTVPNAQNLDAGIALVTEASMWPRMAGRVSVIPQDGSAVQVIEPNRVSFYESSPWSFQNLRNILANWLSSHVLAYGFGLCLVLVALTLATSAVLRVMGRRA